MPVKISVVVPTFHKEALLKKCLNALNEQCFNKQEFEVIVVSDGPDDDTKQLLQEYFRESDLVLRYFFLEKKKGPAAARNLGWKRAKGYLVAFTGDDCIPDTDWLHDLWSAYKGEALVAFSGTVKVPVPVKPTDYEVNLAGIEAESFVSANCCCTKKALELTGGYDEMFSKSWREDSDLEFRLLQHKVPVIKLANAIVIHPVPKAPWGVSITEQKKGMYDALLYKKYPHQFRHKIHTRPPFEYYAFVLLTVFALSGLLLGMHYFMNVSLLLWLLILGKLVVKRLSGTTHSAEHVTEMIVTSAVIPYVSVYWHLYGAWRFKVLFI